MYRAWLFVVGQCVVAQRAFSFPGTEVPVPWPRASAARLRRDRVASARTVYSGETVECPETGNPWSRVVPWLRPLGDRHRRCVVSPCTCLVPGGRIPRLDGLGPRPTVLRTGRGCAARPDRFRALKYPPQDPFPSNAFSVRRADQSPPGIPTEPTGSLRDQIHGPKTSSVQTLLLIPDGDLWQVMR